MKDDLSKEIARLKNLRQNRDKDVSFLEKIAQLNLWKRQIDISNRFSKKEDKDLAEKIFNAYLENNEIESFSDMQNLSDLVFEDVLKEKIQKEIDAIVSDENSKFVPDKLIQSLHDVEERIWKLKEKIGINEDKSVDDLSALEELEERFKVYIPFNRNEFTAFLGYTCSNCKHEDVQPILFRRRVNNFKMLKHPAFSGRFLYNIEIIDDVKEGLITKEQAARYLRTSPQYIDWVLENEHDIISIEEVSKEEVDKFVNDNPNLKSSEFYNGEPKNEKK